ncbi:MAG: TrbC/VirB2 family protein [bacterium]|nr:TrbC/VirB2 family protein [bacterium]
MKRLILASPLVASALLALPYVVRAADTLTNPLGAGTDLEQLLADILSFVVEIGSVVVVLMLVYVGYLFVTARGEPAKITTARTSLLWTVVGALILLGAQAIALAIEETVTAIGA